MSSNHPLASVLWNDALCAPRGGGYRAFGVNPAVGATDEALWAYGGQYNFTIAATQLKLASSNAADDAAGTGARTVRVYGLVNGVIADELVTMDGTTPVNVTTAFTRIYMARVESAGSGEVNAGNIYCFTGTATAGVPNTATEVYFKMAAGGARTHVAIFQVPTGYTGRVVRMWASTGETNNPVQVQFCIRHNGVRRTLSTVVMFQNIYSDTPAVPLEVPAGADMFIQAKCLGAGAPEVSGCFEIVLM